MKCEICGKDCTGLRYQLMVRESDGELVRTPKMCSECYREYTEGGQ